MSAPAVVELPVLRGVLADFDAVHLYHCNDGWALCGQDVSGDEEQPGAEPVCPLCAEAERCWVCGATS